MAHEIEHGDIVILGTDGLWDNLHRKYVVKLVEPFVQKVGKRDHPGMLKDPENLSHLVAGEAEAFSNQH